MPKKKLTLEKEFEERFKTLDPGTFIRKDGKGLNGRDLLVLIKLGKLEMKDELSISDAEGNSPSPVLCVCAAVDDNKNITWLRGE